MVQAANVSQMLQDSSSQFTVFSPVNSAIESAIANNAVICQTDNFLDQPCTSLNDLFNSTSLSELVMNYGEQKSIAWQVSNCCSSPLYSLTVPMPSSINTINTVVTVSPRRQFHAMWVTIPFVCSCRRPVVVCEPDQWHVDQYNRRSCLASKCCPSLL